MNIKARVSKPKDFASVPLQGIEVIDCITGGGGTDFTAITFRDTITKTEVTCQLRNYELCVAATKQKKFETKFVVSWLDGDVESKTKPLSKEDAEVRQKEHDGSVITEISIEVDA